MKLNLWVFDHYADPPDRQATRIYEIGRVLVQKAHQVTIFSSSFNHYTLKEEKLLAGEPWKTEEVNGVNFVWIKTFPYQKNDWRRIVNIITYGLRAFWVGIKMKARPDIIMGKTFHPVAPVAAYALSRFKRCPFFFEIGDLWPQNLIDVNGFSHKHPAVIFLRGLEKFLCRKATRIITLLPYANEYITRFGIPNEKIVWVPNGIDYSRYAQMKIYDGQLSDPVKLMYIGGLTKSHSLETIIQCAKVIQDKNSRPIKFIFIGGGVEKDNLVELSQRLGLDNIEFRNVVPRRELPKIMEEADFFIFALNNNSLYQYGIALSKLWDYLSSGRPLIGATNARMDHLRTADVGFFVPPENPGLLAEAILEMINLPVERRAQMGRNAIDFIKKYHDTKILADKLEQTMQEVMIENASKVCDASRVDILKRLFDMVVSFFGLLCLFPVFVIVAVLIKWEDGGPLFYQGLRVGKDGRRFRMFKFRTMVLNADKIGGPSTADDDPRITKTGKRIRKFKLDEIPQLLNVFTGEMSLVGPRPEVPFYVDMFTEEERKILSVKPGITDWASLWNSDEGSILAGSVDPEKTYFEKIRPQKIKLQLKYVKEHSFMSDMKIIFQTAMKIVSR